MVLQALLAFGLAVGLCAQPAFADVQYVYDEIGRLIQVIDQNGDSARYVYDAAGNITRIRRVSSGTLAVTVGTVSGLILTVARIRSIRSNFAR